MEDVVSEVAYVLIVTGAAFAQLYDHTTEPAEAALLLGGGAIVLFLAHAFADALGAMAASGQPRVADVLAIVARRSVILLTALPFVLLCVLAEMEVYSARSAYRLGQSVAVLALTLAAGIAVRQAGASRLRTLVVGGMAFVLASGVMALERLA
jgi:hypothetical protein